MSDANPPLGSSEMQPSVVMRPIRPRADSPNQSVPSGPGAMLIGLLDAPGMRNSVSTGPLPPKPPVLGSDGQLAPPPPVPAAPPVPPAPPAPLAPPALPGSPVSAFANRVSAGVAPPAPRSRPA